MIQNEYAAEGAVGAAIASSIAAAISSVETIGLGTIVGLLVAAGGVASAAVYFYDAKQDAIHCDYYFNRVKF